MKVLSEMCLSILMVFFLITGITFAQDAAKEYYKKGMKYAIQGDFPKAKKEFEDALKISPSLEPVELCLKTIREVSEGKIKTETAIYFFKGGLDANNGQYDLAISNYNEALKINQKFANAYINRGLAYRNKGEYDRAISDYNKALEIEPILALVYNNRGVVYRVKGEYDRAIRDYNKALEINSNFAGACYNLGIIYHRYKSQYNLAISFYNKAIEINPKYADAYYNRGHVYLMKLGNKTKGCADFKRACELGQCKNYNIAKQNGYCQ